MESIVLLPQEIPKIEADKLCIDLIILALF